ncbi:choline-phosphate cytidylyltransferase [Rhodotorula kratochvilovae]
MSSHAAPTAGSAATAPGKRRAHGQRRLVPEGEGESSREASAESNDETPSGTDDLDGDDSAAETRSLTAPLEGIRLSEGSPAALGTPRAAPGALGSGVAAGVAGEGYDSAGHDGDISSATAASRSPLSAARISSHPHAFRAPVGLVPQQASYLSSASADDEAERGSSPSPPATETEGDEAPPAAVVASRHPGVAGGAGKEGGATKDGEVMWAPAPSGFLSNLTPAEIQEHIRTAIAGDPRRSYKIKPPPEGRPVRIYADGVYDLLHYGHMLQLRQCKLMFPSVHLLVGVCSSSLVRAHKSNPVLSSRERYESMRHVRWVDEVVEDAPWTIDQAFIDKHQIDYVAHDEEPYVSAGSEDVYAFVKSIGAFLPTKRTNGISTSELLQRIVEGYREGDYDGKLRKIGHPELCSRQGSEVGTTYGAP